MKIEKKEDEDGTVRVTLSGLTPTDAELIERHFDTPDKLGEYFEWKLNQAEQGKPG